MRLIDADGFEKSVMFGDAEDMQDVIYALRDYPITYDIDKVVERLEAAKSEIASETYCKAVYNKGLCESKNCFECCAEYLIEIVKAGKING